MFQDKFRYIKCPYKMGLFIILVQCLWLTSCIREKGPQEKKVVLQVDEYKLNISEFADQLARKLKYFDALAAKDQKNISRSKDEIAQNFILTSITKRWAKKNKISVSQTELDQEINQIRSQYPDDLAFRRVLAQENLSFSKWKSNLKFKILEEKVFKKLVEGVTPPKDVELKNYYESNKDLFAMPEQIYLRQIVVNKEAHAHSLRKEARKNKNFKDLARKYSIGPEAEKEGLLGWVQKGTLGIFDKAFKLNIGKISTVLKSEYGFHIFRVEKRKKPGFIPFREAKNNISELLLRKREQGVYTAWLDNQVRLSKILKDDSLLNALIVETREKKE